MAYQLFDAKFTKPAHMSPAPQRCNVQFASTLGWPTVAKIGTRRRRGWLLLFLIVIAVLAQTQMGHTHVRWFVDTDNPSVENFQPFSFYDPAVLIWIAVALSMVGIAVFLDTRLPTIPIAKSRVRHDVMELMRILTGMSLLLTAYEGALVAPHLEAYGTLGTLLVLLQAAIGILLLSNHFIHHAAILIIILFLGMMVQFGFVRSFEYVNVIGISLFLLFNSLPADHWREQLKPFSVDVLRIFTGLSLVTLGITEKLHGAAFGQSFIADHQWNFMPLLGFESFNDQLFILSAGVMEVVFGVILILGVVTRLNILAVACLMLISNAVFLFQNQQEAALTELIGHLPIIATALILLLLGYGQRLKITNVSPRSEMQEALS
ncbi:DoxX family membrane protein [Roseovarius aestuarii]|uniref:DoxX n=1 Tax=Roseovarius aestuarii TaxID=475083 RepID=A0A1X7BYA4_9RHOB|nr:DoxX family membrane protein [Roseovarius aestuarii]SMC14591.1 DoxX [Roseovarius aestuarii]